MDTSSSVHWSARLRRERIRRNWRQQDLADQLGTTVVTIKRWERGSQQASAYFRVKLCTLFGQSAEALGLLPEGPHSADETEAEAPEEGLIPPSSSAEAGLWSVPFPRNPFFTGREEILEALHTQLGVNPAVALTQSSALHGLGGIGKTQIALEYAYRHAMEYSAVFWIGAETEEQIVSGLLRLAEVLQLPGRDDEDQQRVVAAVQGWLRTHGQWLLIWDNVEDLAMLDRFLPAARSGAILITTRCQTLGTLARGLDLLPMEHEEGVLFLLRRAKVLEPEAGSRQIQRIAVSRPSEYAAASELVTAMGGLPLALDQAGAYLEATQCGLPAYLDLFRTQRAVLLRQRGEGARNHLASVSTTFTLAITATAQRHPAVWDLLRVCALLQSDALPEELFRRGAEHLGAMLSAVCRDPLDWNRLVVVARSYSLLYRQPEEQTLSMHRLVQAVLLDGMTEAEREQWGRRAIGAIDAVLPDVEQAKEYATWQQCERLLPHALLCLHRAGATEKSLALAALAYKVAQYLREHGRHAEAEPLYQRALHIREQMLGPDHPLVAYPLNYLAILFREQARYAEAEPLFQRALHIWEQTLGPEHPQVAFPLNSLAILYREQSKYAEAEPLFQRALHIWKRALGPEHPQVTYPLNNLARLYREQGKDAQAEPLFQRALHIREQALGPEHPQVAYPLNNLAILYHEQGKDAEAQALSQRALHILEQALGSEHPQVAYPLNNLANFFREQNKYAEAEALYQRALSVREQHLGQHHPETAQTLHDLSIFRQKQSNLSEALSLAQRALKIRSQSLGDTHPKTVATRTLYAQLLM